MRKRTVLLLGLCALLALPTPARAQIVPSDPAMGQIEQEWSEDWPVYAPDASEQPAAAQWTVSPIAGADDGSSDDDQEQELPDSEPDAKAPKEAVGKRLYILDQQKELLPVQDWSAEARYAYLGMRIPLLFQYNYRKVICYYYGRPKSVASSGCGATSMSMVIAYLTGNTKQSPYSLFRWAVNNDLYEGSGLTHEALLEIGAHYGVGGEWIGRDRERVLSALRAGTPVIAHMGKGQFTNRGHYIVLRGVTDDGKVLVNDPNSWYNSLTSIAFDDIIRQTKSNDPFLLCRVIEEQQEPDITSTGILFVESKM